MSDQQLPPSQRRQEAGLGQHEESRPRPQPPPADALGRLQGAVRQIGDRYRDRLQRARRLFIEERACALAQHRNVEYDIKSEISDFFRVDYSSVSFTGSAQLGFSILKEREFIQQNRI